MVTETLVAAILNESGWVVASLAVTFVAVAGLVISQRQSTTPRDAVVLAALNLSAGTLIACMATGHLIAVTTKLSLGTLVGSRVIYYGVGVLLAVPACGVVAHTRRLTDGVASRRATVGRHASLIVTLIPLDLPNLPLALASVFARAYANATRAWRRWVIVGLAVVVQVGLFVGSLVFFASGRTFEQFSGLE